MWKYQIFDNEECNEEPICDSTVFYTDGLYETEYDAEVAGYEERQNIVDDDYAAYGHYGIYDNDERKLFVKVVEVNRKLNLKVR